MDYPEIPGYTILGRLGEGGMATVYLALQLKFNRKVALKVMAPHLVPDPSFGERFEREAQIVAQMSHRNFIPVFDVGRHGDYHYMSMEYLPNGSLGALMAKGLTIQDGLTIARAIASGLHYAANKNFVHRDIKPENILFREDHSAVICDFGIARQMDSDTNMTAVGTVVGTAHYMSPEQAMAETIDGGSDLYNLGVIIYEMLTGEVPYDGDSALAVSIKHVSDEIPLLPPRLEPFQEFIDKALAKSPQDRFLTGQEMIDALDELEEHEFDLIEDLSATVVMSAVAPPPSNSVALKDGDLSDSVTVLQPHSGLRAKRTSKIVGATGRRRGPQARTAQRARHRSHRIPGGKLGLTVGAISLLAVGGAAYWYLSHPRTVDTPEFVHAMDDLLDRPSTAAAGISRAAISSGRATEKSRDLNRQARESMEDNRLYTPEENNAQYFLTTLLALYPGDVEGLEGISKLYQTYLEIAEEAIEEGDFDQASDVLNQSSQISYYIGDDADVAQQSKLRSQLIVARQQNIITKERTTDIENLLEQGAQLLTAGRLTTPADGNAFDTYQQVLSLEPSNQQASRGIRDIARGFLAKAEAHANAGDYVLAHSAMAAAAQIFPRHPDMASVRDKVIALERQSLVESDESVVTERGDQTAQAKLTASSALYKTSLDLEIQQLLAAAEEDIIAYRLSSPKDNCALQKYNSILELDPTNEPALQGIEAVAVRYVEMAHSAITEERQADAANYLGQAAKLSPANAEYIKAQNRLIESREIASADSAAKNEIDEQVTALLERAMSDVLDNRIYSPSGNNAMLKLRQVLELDPGNMHALQQQEALLLGIFDSANEAIWGGELKQAQRAIEYLAGHKADPRRLQKLRDQLAAATPEDSVSLLNEARGLGGPESVDSGTYRRLATIYLQVLELEQGNLEAQEGLALATRYAADLTANSVRQGVLDIAEMQLGYLENIDPAHPRLPELRAGIAGEEFPVVTLGQPKTVSATDETQPVKAGMASAESDGEPASKPIGDVHPQQGVGQQQENSSPDISQQKNIGDLF